MIRGRSEAETCRLNGWGVGTRLAGDEGYGVDVIEITSLHDGYLFAKRIRHRGVDVTRPRSHSWTLSCREWVEVPPGDDGFELAETQAHGEYVAAAMSADGSLRAKSPHRTVTLPPEESATAMLYRVRQALKNHPRACAKHDDPEDPVVCGWKRAVADVEVALIPTGSVCPKCGAGTPPNSPLSLPERVFTKDVCASCAEELADVGGD